MRTIRRHLGWKLFLSYLIVILVGAISLSAVAEFHSPSAFDRHMTNMGNLTSGMGGMGGMMGDLASDFDQVIGEVLAVSAAFAIAAAVAASTLVTRRIVHPVHLLKEASGRIADGNYEERVSIAGEDELADLARSFNQMATTLSQTEERRRQLIGDVAHELRTPLSSIRSVMEGLVDGVLPAEPATYLDVQREVSRLQRLVHDLEELSRAEAGQIVLLPETTAPEVMVKAAVDRLRLQFEDKGVQLDMELPPSLSALQVDPARMTQVMTNLLGNALQYTAPGGCVTVRAWAEAGEIHISVTDSGIGLTDEHLPHVFERFYRVDKSRSRAGGGSGIGLTISKHLVESHGGRITVESPGLEKGSTFTVILPTGAPDQPVRTVTDSS